MSSALVAAMLLAASIHVSAPPDVPGLEKPHCEAIGIEVICTTDLENILQAGGSSHTGGSDGSAAVEIPGSSSGSSVTVPDRCLYQKVDPRPADDDPIWRDHDPAAGDMWIMLCPEVLSQAAWDSTGQNTVITMNESTPYYVTDGTDPDEGVAGVNPYLLIQRARAAVQMPYPNPTFGPEAGELAVKFPIWLSVDAYEPQTRTATAGRFTAVVTATLTNTVWYPGELVDPYQSSILRVPPVTCDGAGVPYQPGMDRDQPPCGYTYIWRSLEDRTEGAGAWTMTVVSHYEVTSRVTNTQTGEVIHEDSESLEPSTKALLTIREWRGVLGDPTYAAPEIVQIPPVILPHD